MRRGQQPVFLTRASYRVRRLRDAVQLLPFLGGFLFALLLLWEPAEGQGRDLAQDAVYLFAVWFGLIALAALLARRVSRGQDEGRGGPGAGDGDRE